jgi:hypothetical protein
MTSTAATLLEETDSITESKATRSNTPAPPIGTEYSPFLGQKLEEEKQPDSKRSSFIPPSTLSESSTLLERNDHPHQSSMVSQGAETDQSQSKGLSMGKEKKRLMVTPEQRKKLEEQEKERRKALEARIAMLTVKLVERLRPYVEANHPGEKDDPETLAFEAKMRREADDLKLESFGVEVSRHSVRKKDWRRCTSIV